MKRKTSLGIRRQVGQSASRALNLVLIVHIWVLLNHPTETGVCQTNTPPDRKTGWNISFEITKSRARLQLLLLCCMVKAQVKGVFVSQIPV